MTTVDGRPFARRQAGAGVPADARALPGAQAAVATAPAHRAASTRGADQLGQRLRRAVAAVVEHEPAALAPPAGLDLADEQHVVAGAMPRVVAALEPRDAALDQRRVRGAQPIGDAGEAVGVRPRKAARELDLVVREHVDRVALGAPRTRRGSSRARLRLQTTSGGSSDTELNEFAVKPT